MIEEIPIEKIRRDGGTQAREAIHPDTVVEYAEQMLGGVQFPPVTAFYDDVNYWLGDGFHRIEAALQAGLKSIPVDVQKGTQRDAVLFAVGANSMHGLRRTNADKRRSVRTLLNDQEWRLWSDGEIARRSAVSDKLVARVRAELSPEKSEIERMVERNGTAYLMKTSQIGKPNAKATDDLSDVVPAENVLHATATPAFGEEVPGSEEIVEPESAEVARPAATPAQYGSLAEWTWVAVTAGPSPHQCSNGILIVLPDSTPMDSQLAALIKQATKLAFPIYMTPGIESVNRAG